MSSTRLFSSMHCFLSKIKFSVTLRFFPFMVSEYGVWFSSHVGTGDGANSTPGKAKQSLPKFHIYFYFLIFPVFLKIFPVPYHKFRPVHVPHHLGFWSDDGTDEGTAHHQLQPCSSPFPSASSGISLRGKCSIRESPPRWQFPSDIWLGRQPKCMQAYIGWGWAQKLVVSSA